MEIGGTVVLIPGNSVFNDGQVDRAKNQANDVSKFEEMLRKTAASAGHDNADESPAAGTSASSSKFAKIDKADKLYEQCVELEIFLVKTLLGSMRNTVQKSGLINEGYAGKMYEDMLYDEYAKDLAKNANFGMAEMAYLELTGQRGKTVKK
ncbi:MAG: rod-binding protein [Treponema sp.]|jgi:flagellar protein FlgJ|nr:rod-binding protein [Treponema sp.]